MSSAGKHALYIANDLEELNTRVSENPTLEKAKLSTCTQISHMMEATWTEAKKAENAYDEERAYILYMRLFACLTPLRQAKDASTNQVNLLLLPRSLESILFSPAHCAILSEGRADLAGEGESTVGEFEGQVSDGRELDVGRTRVFRYAEKNAVKIAEEQRIQAEIDEEKSRKRFFVDPRLRLSLSSDQFDQTSATLQVPQSGEEEHSLDRHATDAGLRAIASANIGLYSSPCRSHGRQRVRAVHEREREGRHLSLI